MQLSLFIRGGLFLGMKISSIDDTAIILNTHTPPHRTSRTQLQCLKQFIIYMSPSLARFYRLVFNLALSNILMCAKTQHKHKTNDWWQQWWKVRLSIVFRASRTRSSQRCSPGWQAGFTTQLNLKTGSYSGSGLVIPELSAPQPPTGANPPASQPSQPI